MKKLFLLMLVVCLLPSALWAQKKPQKWALDIIQRVKEIQARNRAISTWTPAINSLCFEKRENLVKLCGLLPNPKHPNKPPVFKNNLYRGKGYVDLRNTYQFPVVRNQAHCGSCWAFAMTGAVEFVQLKNGTVSQWIDLSEQQLVSCCTAANGCNGGQIAPTADWIMQNGGLVTENAYPYVSGDGNVPACNTPATTKYTVRECNELGYWIFPASTEDMKQVLDNGYPVVTGYYVYEDFITYKEGVYKHTTGDRLGGHAVLIIGYADAGSDPDHPEYPGHFIVRNSWWLKDDNGNYVKPWGDNGYFRIAYGDSNFGMMAAWVK